jgi:hypothetical protein
MRPGSALLPRLAGIVVVTLATLLVFLRWLGVDERLRPIHGRLNGFDDARVVDIVDGSAHKPYVLRTLVPTTVRLLAAATPERIARKLERRLNRKPFRFSDRGQRLGWEPEHFLEYFWVVVVTGVFFAGFPIALGWLARSLFNLGSAPSLLIGASGVALLPFYFERGSHFLYDPATLTLMALGLLQLRRRSWVWFYVVFAVGCVNRETTALLSLVFVADNARRLPIRSLLRHLGLQVVMWGLVRVSVLWTFRGNPGVTSDWDLRGNLATVQLSWELGLVLGLLGLILASRRVQPRFLLHALLMLPPLAVGYLLVGTWGEIRVFYEVHAVLVLMGIQAVAWLAGRPLLSHCS